MVAIHWVHRIDVKLCKIEVILTNNIGMVGRVTDLVIFFSDQSYFKLMPLFKMK